jgi:hypothetical protein
MHKNWVARPVIVLVSRGTFVQNNLSHGLFKRSDFPKFAA